MEAFPLFSTKEPSNRAMFSTDTNISLKEEISACNTIFMAHYVEKLETNVTIDVHDKAKLKRK